MFFRKDSYKKVIEDTAAMVSDGAAQKLAQKYGLTILNVTWEDTGRYKGSAVGPNISDMTIQVQHKDERSEKYALTCMPVIRYPNFEDRSADLLIDDFFLLTGNEKGRPLRRVTLRQYLEDLRGYLSQPRSWKGNRRSLLSPRDKHVLVSAQACFLPVPKQGLAEFNPVLFNYQSEQENPAVLAILCSREGTSATIIDNTRDGFSAGHSWGQRLFFNKNGERCSLTGQRLSDFQAEGTPSAGEPSAEVGPNRGLNMVLLIQVPLKQKERPRMQYATLAGAMPCAPAAEATRCRADVEEAVIGHGKVEGPYTEIDDLAIERDERFPVRVTVQFYKATSNGVMEQADMAGIAAQIFKVYAEAKYVGSLVVDGDTGRPTEYDDEGQGKHEPPGWWDDFWRRHEHNTGQSREQALLMLWELLGPGWMPRTQAELTEALRKGGRKG